MVASPSTGSLAKAADHASLVRKGLAAVKKYVKSNKSLISQEDGDKQTLLHAVASEGDLEILNWLLKHAKPADMKKRDKTGWTPLHVAGHGGKLDLYEALLRKGASPNAQNAHLTSPFVYLCRHAPMGTESMSPAFLNLLDLNMEKGVDIDNQNTNGETALHDSTSRGMVELTRYLLLKGADPNALNQVGESPLHKAVQCRHAESSLSMVKILVENSADTTVCGLTGSPLAIALMHKNTAVADFLKNKKSSSHPKEEGADYRVHASKSLGPSYDNLDMATLLGIRPSTGGGGSISTTQKPGSDDIVESNEGFNFELGTQLEMLDDLADLQIDDDMMTFDYKGCQGEEIVNIMGVYKTAAKKDTAVAARMSSEMLVGKNVSDERSMARRFFCITVLKTPDNGKLRGLLRTQTGDHRFYIPVTALKDKSGGKGIQAKDIFKELLKELPELDQKGISKCILVDNPGLQAELFKFEQSKALQASRMKIGILYAKKGQTTEEEIFGNEHGSEDFEKFLRLLGDVITLEGWEGFKGDLDVKHNRTGTHSLHTTFRKTDIMFHVATYLPHSNEDEQQIAKKRCIGNDLTTIIYLEEGATFKPPCVSGDFLHVFAAVQPATTKEGKPGFRIAFSSREGVPNFGPIIPKPAVFASEGAYFRDFLLTKLINGERASLHSDFLVSKMIKTRQMFLESLVQNFVPSLDDS